MILHRGPFQLGQNTTQCGKDSSYSVAFSAKQHEDSLYSGAFSTKQHEDSSYSGAFSTKQHEDSSYYGAFSAKQHEDSSYYGAFSTKQHEDSSYSGAFSTKQHEDSLYCGAFSTKQHEDSFPPAESRSLYYCNSILRFKKKTVEVQKGQGILTVFGPNLSSGTYSYSLIVDGKAFETKRMVKMK